MSPRAIRPSQDLNRNSSPVKLRMQHLSNRLQGLQDELLAEKQTSVDDKNIKRMRIEHRYTKPRLPMPTDDDRITMLAEQVGGPALSAVAGVAQLQHLCRLRSPARSSLS